MFLTKADIHSTYHPYPPGSSFHISHPDHTVSELDQREGLPVSPPRFARLDEVAQTDGEVVGFDVDDVEILSDFDLRNQHVRSAQRAAELLADEFVDAHVVQVLGGVGLLVGGDRVEVEVFNGIQCAVWSLEADTVCDALEVCLSELRGRFLVASVGDSDQLNWPPGESRLGVLFGEEDDAAEVDSRSVLVSLEGRAKVLVQAPSDWSVYVLAPSREGKGAYQSAFWQSIEQ